MNKEMTSRIRLLIEDEKFDKFKMVHIAIFGLGGVGSYAAECLIRSGFNNFTIVDADIISESNINRQAQVFQHNIGLAKSNEMKNFMLQINPNAQIKELNIFFSERTINSFDFQNYDYVIDAIDSIQSKALLIKTCFNLNLKIFSSMGAGGKLDPTKIKIAKLKNTHACGLAKNLKKILKEELKDNELITVFSEEISKKITNHDNLPYHYTDNNERIGAKFFLGSSMSVTATFGLSLASLVIRDIIGDIIL